MHSPIDKTEVANPLVKPFSLSKYCGIIIIHGNTEQAPAIPEIFTENENIRIKKAHAILA